jgi:hypothetical protein
MKIAIPTDDGIMLPASSKNSKGYLVLTINGGEITNEELRWNKLSDLLTSENGIPQSLNDCPCVIVNPCFNGLEGLIKSKKIEAIITKEVIITKVIMEYLNITMRRESNICCSP